MTEMDQFPLTTRKSRRRLNESQLAEYKDYRRSYAEWLMDKGKKPDRHRGYSESVVRNTLKRTDLFNRWVWDDRGRFTLSINHQEADDYIDHRLEHGGQSETDNSHTVKAIKRLFKWRSHRHGGSLWECDHRFSSDNNPNQPYFDMDQRRRLRDHILEYKRVESYEALTENEREQVKIELAQRFSIPKSEITELHWLRANSWKLPSLISCSLDIGLRPTEIEDAELDWINLDKGTFEIPRDESSKNENYWNPSLLPETARRLERWLDDRGRIPLYKDSNKIWLTSEGDTYQSASLKKLLRRICDEFQIADQPVHWYMMRRSVGTYLTDEMDIADVADQMRHEDIRTTRRYNQSSHESRRQGLKQMRGD